MVQLTTLTDEQFSTLIDDRQQATASLERAVAHAERLTRENMALLMGLVHYSKEEVATMLHCSTKQVERYEKAGGLIPTRIGGKVLYSASSVRSFLDAYQPGLVSELPSSLPRPRKRNQ